MAAIAYYILQRAIIGLQGRGSLLAKAIGNDWKGKLSPVIYLTAIVIAFFNARAANTLYVLVAIMWLVPDRRIEKVVVTKPGV
jgi:hypothetical protein